MPQFKSTLLFAVIMLLSVYAAAQSNAKDFETKCRKIITSLPKEQQPYFDSITAIREHNLHGGILARIDTLKYDYLFIQEQFYETDNWHQTSEYYFNSGDTLPSAVFTNGIYRNPRDLFGENIFGPPQDETNRFHLFANMYSTFSQNKAFQELSYNPNMYIARRFAETDENVEKILTESEDRLKKTYQIMTMFDKKGNIIHVSVQEPASNPTLKAVFYDDIWGW